MRGVLLVGALLLGTGAMAQDAPADPLRPFPDGVPELPPVPDSDPARADPVLNTLDDDISTWGAEAFDASATLRGALKAFVMRRRLDGVEGRALDAGIERLDVTLQVLAARRRLARTGLEALGIALDEGRQARLDALEVRYARALRENAGPLLSAWVYRIDTRVKAGDVDGALADAEALTGRLDGLAEDGLRAGQDDARMVLIRLALRFHRPDLVLDWGARCGWHCSNAVRPELLELVRHARGRIPGQESDSIDPLRDLVAPSQEGRPLPQDDTPLHAPPPAEHLAFRVTATWTPGLATGTHLGLPVRRLASGAVDVAIAPTPTGCGAVRLARDRFDYETAEATRRLGRTRVELAWCPRLLTTRVGPGALSLRAAIGPGISWGTTRVPPTYDERERLVGWGIAVRLEAPLRFGPVEIVPALGAAPYGRAVEWGLLPERSDLAFVDRVHAGIGLSWGRRARR